MIFIKPLKVFDILTGMNTTILVVDDDHKTVDLIRLYLEKDGYRILPAYDGSQALAIAREKHPDLIILDLMLPKIDGLEVCRILRAESRIPIIMLTAKTTGDDKLIGLDLGRRLCDQPSHPES
jgi:DNA-binding response OmpR family regulator